MATLARRTVTSFIYKSNASFSLYYYHYYFSTNTTKQRVDATTLCGFLIGKHHFSPESASRVAASVLASEKNHPEKYDSILSFLRESGFSKAQMEKVLKFRPRALSANVGKIIKPKITLFQDLGFSNEDIATIVSKTPLLLHCSVNNRLIPSLLILKGLVGSYSDVAAVLKTYGRVLATDLEKTLLPNIEFLKRCGVAEEQIIRFLYLFPRFLSQKPENMRRYVERTAEMGVCGSSRMFIYAARVLGSMTDNNWELKLKTFRDLGFSEDDILRVFSNAPTVLSTSENKIKKVIEVLLETGKYDMSCIVEHPTTFMYSVEERYKPRLHLLGILEKSNLIKSWPGLGTWLSMSDERFFNKFVAPYLDEVGEVYNERTPYRKRRSRKVGHASTS